MALCHAVGGIVNEAGAAHPIYYYIATQVAMGISVADLCALCNFDVADGPMITHSKVTFDRELRVDEDYDVSGGITSLERRPSRTFGAVDVLTFTLTLDERAGDRAATCTSGWLLPRRQEAK